MDQSALGKKVFFIYPHSVIQNQLIQDLIDSEYEVYFINDSQKVELICESYSSPILFINIDEGLEEYEWEQLIRSIMEKDSTSHSKIGIVTYNENTQLAQKYLMDLMVPCGFITLKLGINDSRSIIIKTLEANEVKGKRHFVRAQCAINEATFNVSIDGSFYSGYIADISSVGMAIRFHKEISLKKSAYIKDIQLKLRGSLLHVSAVVIGFRAAGDEQTLFVLLFDQYVNEYIKSKLRSFISRSLQHQMEKKLDIKNRGQN